MWDTFEGRILMHTNAAVFFEGQYWEGGLWFPKSQLIIESDGLDSEYYVIKVKSWLTKKNGLLEFTHYAEPELEAMRQQ